MATVRPASSSMRYPALGYLILWVGNCSLARSNAAASELANAWLNFFPLGGNRVVKELYEMLRHWQAESLFAIGNMRLVRLFA